MLVQRVALPTVRVDSWTVLGDDDVPVEPIERLWVPKTPSIACDLQVLRYG
jgi:hypothetical protein